MRIEAAVLQDLDRFLKFFSSRVSRRMQLDSQIDQYWDDGLGSNTSCTEYFEEYILANCDRPILLALDNADRLFPYGEVAANFFSLLRDYPSSFWRLMGNILGNSGLLHLHHIIQGTLLMFNSLAECHFFSLDKFATP